MTNENVAPPWQGCHQPKQGAQRTPG